MVTRDGLKAFALRSATLWMIFHMMAVFLHPPPRCRRFASLIGIYCAAPQTLISTS
jgi:hypothetical protein